MSNLPSPASVRTAFITGATGQDGSYLADQQAGQGWSVHALVRTSPTRGSFVSVRGFNLHPGDLTGHLNLTRVLRTDYVDALGRMATYKEADDFVIATGISHTVRDFVSSAFEAAGIHHVKSACASTLVYSANRWHQDERRCANSSQPSRLETHCGF
jgi:GDP-D-mannose dehydratase